MAIVANGQAQFQEHIEVAIKKLITHLVNYILLNPSTAALDSTLNRLSLRWIEQNHLTHAAGAGGGNGFAMVADFVGCEMWLT